MRGIVKALLEEVGNGNRVIRHFCIDTQAWRDKSIVEIRPDYQTNGNPGCRKAAHIDRTGQPHQHPATHIRGPGRQGTDSWVQIAAAKHVFGHVAGRRFVGIKSDGHHQDEIRPKRYQFGNADCHIFLAVLVKLRKSAPPVAARII